MLHGTDFRTIVHKSFSHSGLHAGTALQSLKQLWAITQKPGSCVGVECYSLKKATSSNQDKLQQRLMQAYCLSASYFNIDCQARKVQLPCKCGTASCCMHQDTDIKVHWNVLFAFPLGSGSPLALHLICKQQCI